MRDLLSDAVFVKFKIGGFQPVDDLPGLPVERLRVDHDQIGAQPDALCKNNFALRRVLDCGLRIANCKPTEHAAARQTMGSKILCMTKSPFGINSSLIDSLQSAIRNPQ